MRNKDSKLRVFLILLFFIVGLALVFFGWTLTGKITGLLIMILGVLLLILALFVYNFAYFV